MQNIRKIESKNLLILSKILEWMRQGDIFWIREVLHHLLEVRLALKDIFYDEFYENECEFAI